ncbi:amino acid deaminase/aldolase [Modestobacter versicolor]|uniref:amino acid deaminase/aldolase n=1 Tax=Modestobacter versicolor TaxID=429133 RepID=UPI0034DDEB8E
MTPGESAAATRARLDAATAGLDPPLAVVDLGALDANADDLVRRAAGRPVRVASKSVRNRAVLRRVLARPGFAGVLAYSLAEALWLAGADGDDPVSTDVVVGYPTVDRAALRRLAADEQAAARVTLMVDSADQLDVLDAVAPPGTRPAVRVCLDLDASWRLGPAHVGVRRSPVHTPDQAHALARALVARPGVALVGVMAYEAQIAGLGDSPAGRPLRGLAVRGMQRSSARELAARRAAAVAAVREVAALEFVNGGGTGSLERTAAEPAVTELAAGSGLYSPTLFDGYRAFRGRPAALFALPVTRLPGPGLVTVAGGGWIASGPPGPDRVPVPTHPAGLRLVPTEGAGEVQTPLRGPGTAGLRVGDRVWFRHAKAGELCERVDELHAVSGDAVVAAWPTYRGEGRTFG